LGILVGAFHKYAAPVALEFCVPVFNAKFRDDLDHVFSSETVELFRQREIFPG
jgi:hypothetical protein